jgi:fatty acid amide hydrolase 2
MRANDILSASAVALAQAIRERRTTSREVVLAHIARAQRVNPGVNAIVKDRYDAALADADAADARVRAGHTDELPPLHGVPCTIKEAIAYAGMPNSSGLWSRRDLVAPEDATPVRRLREAGVIPLGVTNVSELCMWMESSNRVWGRTNNAYDPKRTAGGSSGGEGAIVGAGASPFGLGSDVGGSIRMPAFFNGVFGHKPTGGVVPTTGHYPPAQGLVQRYVVAGPIARRAEDLMPLLRILAGPDGVEEHAIASELGDPASVDLSRLRVISVETDGLLGPEKALVSAQRRAASALEAHGARVERRKIRRLTRSLEIWSAMLHEGGSAKFRDLMADGGELHPLRELARVPFGRSHFTTPGLLLALLERVPEMLGAKTGELAALGRELQLELEELLGDEGVMLYPSHPAVAPRHGVPLLLPFRWVYTAIINVLEMPATQVPLGLDARGLPLGVQVVGPRHADHRTIAVAMELERAFGGWVPPARFASP